MKALNSRLFSFGTWSEAGRFQTDDRWLKKIEATAFHLNLSDLRTTLEEKEEETGPAMSTDLSNLLYICRLVRALCICTVMQENGQTR